MDTDDHKTSTAILYSQDQDDGKELYPTQRYLPTVLRRIYHDRMARQNYENRRRLEGLDRDELQRLQLSRLNTLLDKVLPSNTFYRQKLTGVTTPVRSLEQLAEFPFTEKSELISTVDASDFANHHTFEFDAYSRFHRTSGTHGRPMVVLDTLDDWQWWIETWQFVLDAAEISPSDRVAMAFSFGPFIGFWSANDAVAARGALVIPCGGMDTVSRLKLICESAVSVVCCTPTYAMRMADVAGDSNIDLRSTNVSRIIVAGEPGGSIPTFRERIETAWEAKVVDHSGATEIGPWGYAENEGSGLHIIESEFIAEFISVETKKSADEGELSELVLTTLGRVGCPVIRYRTGDLVRPYWRSSSSNRFVYLDGGVLGRADDMMIIRGVNIFPSSIEAILRGFPEVDEYRITAKRDGQMDAITIEAEISPSKVAAISRELKTCLGLSVDVVSVKAGTLPRFEAKGKRFVDLRS